MAANPNCFVGITDIADFFPKIYQHRLINAVEAATAGAQREEIRALEKMTVPLENLEMFERMGVSFPT